MNLMPSAINQPSSLFPKLTVAIQAGGKSTRMGSNKALSLFLGQPLILRVIDRVQSLTDKILIIANNNDLQPLAIEGIDIFTDIIADMGPLGGLFSSLTYAHTEYIAMLACDLAFVSPALIRFQLDQIEHDHSDVVIPESENGFEPLHALYRRDTCLPAVQKALEKGNRRVISWFEEMKITVIPAAQMKTFDPQLKMFLNINTPEDLQSAEQYARQAEEKNNYDLK